MNYSSMVFLLQSLYNFKLNRETIVNGECGFLNEGIVSCAKVISRQWPGKSERYRQTSIKVLGEYPYSNT
jgi:hypothetical protein